jgi:alpha-L-fucosidase
MHRRHLLKLAAAQALVPSALRAALAKAQPLPPGPFEPTWESLRSHYQTPPWFHESKFGIFIHWGLYAIPAYHNEWYAKHMYNSFAAWHTEHYGPPDQFGYKDFIPLFKAEKYDPDAWASLFQQSGARYVVPVAEHHDGFAMWNSSLTEWCAGKMGPRRDLIGELAAAVRTHGLVFGLSSHRMEHHTFMYPAANVKSDQFDPRYADFYGPPVPGNMNDGNASPEFQEDWLARCQELIDKYQPQMVYFDNGVNHRAYDAVKLRCAAYYYNRADKWRKPATFATKDTAYLAGSVLDFEKAVRGPKDILDGAWQIDDQIATNTWGYTNDIKYRSAASIINELIDTVAKGGNLLLNISPKADGTIPEEQRQILLTVGKWLSVNGEAIYSARPWKKFGEPGFHFTSKPGAVYAIGNAAAPILQSLAADAGKVSNVALLGVADKLEFTQTAEGLSVKLPPGQPSPYVLKVSGL